MKWNPLFWLVVVLVWFEETRAFEYFGRMVDAAEDLVRRPEGEK